MAEPVFQSSTKKKADYADLLIALACGLTIASTALFLALLPLAQHLAGSRDYVVYWATGQQLAHHANPFDTAAMGQLEHAAGFTGKGSYFMRNPPWSLPLALPLGYMSARVAALPWSLLMLGLLLLSVRVLWKMFGRPGTHIQWLGYCFPPALICVMSGQTAILLLTGLVLFLRLHRSRPFWAGASLWLCTLKPHLFLPWAAVLLVWIVVSRSYRILAGAATALAASCVLTAIIDPAAWSQYMHWADRSGITHEFMPCFSILLRDLINPAAQWLVFVLPAIGSVWALAWFWPRRHAWDWLEHGNLVMLVSILVAPYCWLWDHSLAIPALLYGACRTPSRMVLAGLAALFIVLELEPYVFQVGLNSKIFVWPAVAWIVWYLIAMRSARAKRSVAVSESAPVASTV
ncbi:MAG: glycosyltransferase family 87 protein [Acidobacteriaceae bacterium]